MGGRLRTIMTAGALASAVLLSGCSGGEPEAAEAPTSEDSAPASEDSAPASEDSGEHEGHGGHDHPADGGPPPSGITESADPTYPVGTEVTLTADHMPGMDGATATISGAYETVTYAVDFTPTTGRCGAAADPSGTSRALRSGA